MTNPNATLKMWTKPGIDVTPIQLAEYYHVSRTDEGTAQHHS